MTEQGRAGQCSDWINRTRFLNDALKHDAGMAGKPGWVYILSTEDKCFFKIGMTVRLNPFLRLNTLDPQPYQVKSLYAVAKTRDARRAERILHKCFGDRHVKREWFRLNSDDLEWILTTMEFARTEKEFEAMLS